MKASHIEDTSAGIMNTILFLTLLFTNCSEFNFFMNKICHRIPIPTLISDVSGYRQDGFQIRDKVYLSIKINELQYSRTSLKGPSKMVRLSGRSREVVACES